MRKVKENLNNTELAEFWKQKFGQAPFLNISKVFLTKYYIYTEQEKTLGSLSSNCLKQLNKLVNKYEKDRTINDKEIQKSKTILLEVGTKFIREFKGERHKVIVVSDGYQYNRTIYKSLSAIANHITGTRWNGKVFFGVKNK